MMRNLFSVLCCVCAIPFLFCSCFDTEIKSISLSESNLEITVGDTMDITVSVEPSDAEIKKITWLTSDNNVVTVKDGTIKGKAAGNAVITAETENGLKKSCNITVKDKEITAVVLSDTSTSVKEGSKIQLTVKIQPPDAPNSEMRWASDDESIAQVNSDGFVTGVKEGTTKIICKAANGVKASCSVTVKSIKPISATVPSTEPVHKVNPSEPSADSSKTSSSDYMFPNSSLVKLNENQVSRLSSEEAQAAINEIFARNGYVFKNKDLQSYYESKPWYTPNSNFNDSQLNEVENYNIGLFSKYR